MNALEEAKKSPAAQEQWTAGIGLELLWDARRDNDD